MKLAEALIERKALEELLVILKRRLLANALVQEGHYPAEDPIKLTEELRRAVDDLMVLISRIETTNRSVSVDGISLSEMITKRDLILREVYILSEFLDKTKYRYCSSELLHGRTVRVRRIFSVAVTPCQKKLDELSHQARLLDAKIRGANWNTELL